MVGALTPPHLNPLPQAGEEANEKSNCFPAPLGDVDVHDLPPLARELVALIGFASTLQLVGAHPGLPVFVPKALPPDHALIGILGDKNAGLLVRRYGGETITIPNCKLAMTRIRQRHILKSRADGQSQTQTARLHNITPRWVRELESRDQEPERNLRLF